MMQRSLALRTSDTIIMSFASYKFVTYFLTYLHARGEAPYIVSIHGAITLSDHQQQSAVVCHGRVYDAVCVIVYVYSLYNRGGVKLSVVMN